MKILISDLKKIISNEKFKTILLNKFKSINILFVPSTLMQPLKTNKYIMEAINLLSDIGITINSWDVVSDKNSICQIDFYQYQLVYLMGGSITEQNLMHKELSKKLLNYKGVILGISAGALNMCSEVMLTSVQLESSTTQYFPGIGLVDDYIEVHFDINNKKQCLELIESNHKVICITDTGCYVNNNNIKEFIGDIYVCDNGHFILLGK